MNAPADLPRSTRLIDDEDLNPTTNPDFQQVLDARLSRRSCCAAASARAATAVLGSFEPGRLRRQ